MRVLVTANDAFGHVLPLAPAVAELVRRGHDVLVACPGGTADCLAGLGARVRRYHLIEPPPPEPFPRTGDHAARLAWAVRVSWPNAARGWAADLLVDAREFRPDLVISEPIEHAGRVVAAALSVPLVEHGWGVTLPAGTDAAAVAGLADLYRTLSVEPREPALRVDPGPAALQSPDAEPGVWRYRCEPWAPPADPLPPPGGAPRILLTLGTYPHGDAADRLRVAATAAAGLDADLVVALGHDDRGDGSGWPPGARVVRWLHAPSETARTSLVVHHGGAGMSCAAIAAGVPAVCLPQAGDQFRNASLLSAAGAARVVAPEVVLPPEGADGNGAGGNGAGVAALREVFGCALADPALAEGAARCRAANDALPPVAALVDRIESLSGRSLSGRYPR